MDTNSRFELKPIHDGAKSFYKKAYVHREIRLNNRVVWFLKSYGTDVAKKYWDDSGKPHIKIYGWYSTTTARHINEWLQQHGVERLHKSQMYEQPDILLPRVKSYK